METEHAPAPTRLADLLGDAATDFVTTTWGRTPRHLTSTNPTRYERLVTLAQIDEILSYPSTRPPYVRVFKAGKLVDPDEYTYSGSVARREVTGLLDQGRLMKLFDDGATIVLDSIHHWIPEVRQLCSSLQEELGADGRATAFVSPPHRQGLELHADSYEIFVLQLAGLKEWSLYPRLDPVPRAGAILDPEDFAATKPERVVLRPGDLLYLPWGTPHSVRPLDSLSAHVAIALSFPTWADVLSDLVRPILDDSRLNEPAHPARAQEEDLAARLKNYIDLFMDAVATIDPKASAASLTEQATRVKRAEFIATLAGR